MVTLIGSMLGQIIFGFAADKWGRARFYGYELAIILVSTIGVSMCSYGVLPATESEFRSSMSVHGWFYFWRLVAGIGVGAEYPLTAVLAAEYVFSSRALNSGQTYLLTRTSGGRRTPRVQECLLQYFSCSQ
jgi:PHS family inorganic phosphate transporter-like MFS transporter